MFNILYSGTLDADKQSVLSPVHSTPKTSAQVPSSHCKTRQSSLTGLQAT